jgi:hypothetical protein
MHAKNLSSTIIALAIFSFAGAAHALPGFAAQVPNGAASNCFACHTNGGSDSAAKTAFADAFKAAGKTWTADLANADSDGDGQTNGQELGDPCGTWKSGAEAPRADNISNPGDPASKSSTPTEPACDGSGNGAATTGETTGTGVDPGTAAGPGTPKPVPQTGACASIAPIGTGGTLGALWLAFGAMAIRRRLQRKG